MKFYTFLLAFFLVFSSMIFAQKSKIYTNDLVDYNHAIDLYENKPDFEYAKDRVEIMKEKMNVDYDFVIAGTSTTKSVSESLPMLENVISFPTTIIIDKKGKVRRIHTGFSGPATGAYYEKFVDDFNGFVKELLEEE